MQRGSAILHAEMDAIENAGRLRASDYRRAVLYSTLSPCDMCSGTVLLYRIPCIVIGENRTFRGPEDYVRARGVHLEILDDPECRQLMEEFIRNQPALWNEDIGEPQLAALACGLGTSLDASPGQLIQGACRSGQPASAGSAA
ncbi:MAG: nucleoside deaminase [Pirellulales bacterium]